MKTDRSGGQVGTEYEKGQARRSGRDGIPGTEYEKELLQAMRSGRDGICKGTGQKDKYGWNRHRDRPEG